MQEKSEFLQKSRKRPGTPGFSIEIYKIYEIPGNSWLFEENMYGFLFVYVYNFKFPLDVIIFSYGFSMWKFS